MSEEIDFGIEEFKEALSSTIEAFKKRMATISAGKASPQMLSGITAEYYGANTPINQLASINAIDARTLIITPFDKSSLGAIEQAIFAANLGVTPQNDGDLIRITMPMLTEQRRKELVKKVKDFAEDARISVRNSRRTVNDIVKAQVKAGVSEDAGKRYEDEIQKITNKYVGEIDSLFKQKESNIMTV